MREKLLLFMKKENLTSSRLAELLGIQPSGISHILAGRNKPSFDFVHKLLRRYPKLNPDWLLLDSEQMYRDSSLESNAQSQPMPSSEDGANINSGFSNFSDDTSSVEADDSKPHASQNSHISSNTPIVEKISHSQKAIKRVIILYADRTFESYEG